RCGHTPSTANTLPIRLRKTATSFSPMRNGRPKPTGTSSSSHTSTVLSAIVDIGVFSSRAVGSRQHRQRDTPRVLELSGVRRLLALHPRVGVRRDRRLHFAVEVLAQAEFIIEQYLLQL